MEKTPPRDDSRKTWKLAESIGIESPQREAPPSCAKRLMRKPRKLLEFDSTRNRMIMGMYLKIYKAQDSSRQLQNVIIDMETILRDPSRQITQTDLTQFSPAKYL